jgi:hypothetical protein
MLRMEMTLAVCACLFPEYALPGRQIDPRYDVCAEAGISERFVMTRHLPIREFARANLAIALTLMWGGVVACVVVACTYDVGRWLHAW